VNLKVKGLVIKETGVGENDKVLTILAENLGKIQAWAKGSKKLKSPLTASSQCFTYAIFELFKNKDTYTINQAEIIESNFNIRNDLESLALASYIAELANKFTYENSADDEILKLTLNTLYLISKNTKPKKLIKTVYELRLMELSGFMPEIYNCVICGGELTGKIYFDSHAGGVVCKRCSANGDAIEISPSVLAALRFILTCEDKKIFSFNISDRSLNCLSKISESFVLAQADYSFKTLEFYKSLI